MLPSENDIDESVLDGQETLFPFLAGFFGGVFEKIPRELAATPL